MQKQLLHYFQFCAIKDRLDSSSLSSAMKTNRPALEDVMSAIKVSAEEKKSLLFNYIVLISRILIDNMSYFHLTFSDLITPHIRHKYSQEMSKESEVVSVHKLLSGNVIHHLNFRYLWGLYARTKIKLMKCVISWMIFMPMFHHIPPILTSNTVQKTRSS